MNQAEIAQRILVDSLADTSGIEDSSSGMPGLGKIKDQELIELLFFAYRDFVSDPDRILPDFNFGRAHHRVLHFVHLHPGLTIAELLDILRITKQSLNRVLKELIHKGFIESRTGTNDRRQRLLFATGAGETLSTRLSALQSQRIQRALRILPPGSADIVCRFLLAMIDEDDQDHVKYLVHGP